VLPILRFLFQSCAWFRATIVRQTLDDFKRELLVAAATFLRAIIIASRDVLETDISVLTNTVTRTFNLTGETFGGSIMVHGYE